MDINDFSSRFDTLLNSYALPNNFGTTASPTELDEYEKSVLLTTAQNEIVIGLYNGTLKGESLEGTEELRRNLDALIETDNPTEVAKDPKIDSRAQFFKLKDNVWFITYESADLVKGAYCKGNPTIEVIPVKQDEWHRIKNNPFRQPNKRKAIRLDSGDKIVEIISVYPIKNYTVRYLRKPNPIILTDLDDGLKIDGISTKTECELSTSLHEKILDVAVQLARQRLAGK